MISQNLNIIYLHRLVTVKLSILQLKITAITKRVINNFAFKQFTIKQQRAAMRVNTDGVMLGAWADVNGARHVLDIGTGTGAIALMVAQRNHNAKVKAIEIDYPSYLDAEENITDSIFSERVEAIYGDLQTYALASGTFFDHIITNPPFFNSGTQSPSKHKAHARHTDLLSFGALITSCKHIMYKGASLSLILPSREMEHFNDIASKEQLHLRRICQVYRKPEAIGRILATYIYEVDQSTLHKEQLLIRQQDGDYSPAYKELTKAFYLNY